MATNNCPAFSSCNFAYIQGASLTVKTRPKNLIDCEQFTSWLGACAGQSETCSLVINSNLSTDAVFGNLPGCIPR